MLEAIEMSEEIVGKKLSYKYSTENRIGDHIWYISDLTKFKFHYPEWNWKYSLHTTLQEMYTNMINRY